MSTLKGIWSLASIFLFLGIFGCSSIGDNVPKVGFHTTDQATTIPHPGAEYSKRKEITRFSSILAPELLTELDVEAGAIVWPVVAKQQGQPIVKGSAFIVGINQWGDIVLEALLPIDAKDAKQSRFLIVSRDGSRVYTLGGVESEYDSERFEDDEVYQGEVFAGIGLSSEEIEASWRGYYSARGVRTEAISFEILTVGSDSWHAYIAALEEGMKANKMPSGEIRLGTVTTDELQRQVASSPGSTFGQRFGRAFSIGLDPASVALGLLQAGISASFEPLRGFYASAEGRRRDQASNYRWLVRAYQQILAGQMNRPIEE